MTENTCGCTSRHVPLPHQLLIVPVGDSEVTVCPTTYFNVVALAREYSVFGGPPPGSLTKHFSKFVRDLVFALYQERMVE
jgi:hypothetical protein